MAPILYALHENPSWIWLQPGEDIPVGVRTSTGGTQGSGAGVIHHAFGVKPLYDALQLSCSNFDTPAYFVGYSDDGNTSGETKNTCSIIDQYQAEGPACGAIPNIQKTHVLLGEKANEEEVQECIEMYTERGVLRDNICIHPVNGGDIGLYGKTYLGVPIGTDEFITLWLEKKFTKYEEELEALKLVENPQHKWLFLYYCFARKPSYVLRHIIPSISADFCDRFDTLLRHAFESIIHTPLTDIQWKQVTIPIRHGGFGLPATQVVAKAAFTANALESKDYLLRKFPVEVSNIIDPQDGDENQSRLTKEFLSCFENTRTAFTEYTEVDDEENPVDQWENKFQMHLDGLTLQYFFTNVMSKKGKFEIKSDLDNDVSAVKHGLFLSVAKSHTGDFLLACPKTPTTTFQPADFIASVKMRLCCDLNNIPTRCNCAKRPFLTKQGAHLLHCPKGGTLIHRHNSLQQEFKALATSAGVLASSCNKDVVLLNQAGDTRYGDLILPQCGEDGKNLLLDFTITHPICPTYLRDTRRDPSSSLRRATTTKNNKYMESAVANDITFMPMALECYGALSKECIHVIKMLCEKRADIAGSNKSVVTQYWYKRISCTLHKGNSKAISKRVLDITQSTTTGGRDECYDHIIDQEFVNNDTATNFHH